ncbi:MAG: phytoene desaturase family protein [Campylobacterota bacterium]
MKDYAVVGSGIGGSCASLMLSKNYDTTLFEKDSNLGGCSSSFTRFKNRYNTGATTFAGYKKGALVYEFFKSHRVDFETKPLQSALTVVQQGQSFKRLKDFDAFLQEIDRVHPHPKNKAFYTLIRSLNEKFYAIDNYYYSNADFLQKMRSLTSFRTLFWEFKRYLFVSGKDFIKSFFGSISHQYLDYIDNQLLIVAQAKSEEVNFLTTALALGYQFQDNHYVYGGMGTIFEAIAQQLEVEKNCEITKIQKHANHYTLHSKERSFNAKNIVLNSTIFDSSKLFENSDVKKYLGRYKGFDSNKSAFMLYLQLRSPHDFDHHYQIIEAKPFCHTISNSIFVSFGDNQDKKMQNSVTISIHVDKHHWDDDYETKKEDLEKEILQTLEKRLGIATADIKRYFSAKPFTYKRYINRSTLGGIPMKKQNLIYKLPSNDTPIKGLYMVGDTTFAAQGWPGVMMGVRNLERLTCKS